MRGGRRCGVAFSVGDFLWRHYQRKLLARERESSLSLRSNDAPTGRLLLMFGHDARVSRASLIRRYAPPSPASGRRELHEFGVSEQVSGAAKHRDTHGISYRARHSDVGYRFAGPDLRLPAENGGLQVVFPNDGFGSKVVTRLPTATCFRHCLADLHARRGGVGCCFCALGARFFVLPGPLSDGDRWARKARREAAWMRRLDEQGMWSAFDHRMKSGGTKSASQKESFAR